VIPPVSAAGAASNRAGREGRREGEKRKKIVQYLPFPLFVERPGGRRGKKKKKKRRREGRES